MRRSIVTLLSAMGLGAGTFAGAPAALAAQPYDWTGPYIGGYFGGAWGAGGSGSAATTSTFFFPASEFSPSEVAQFNAAGQQNLGGSAFLGGLEAGYNWQRYIYVVGIEGDIGWFDLNGSASTGPLPFGTPPVGTFTINSNVSADWLATIRGRVGVSPANWLFYATGGAAFSTLHAGFSFSETGFASSETASASATRIGWAVGGGIEVRMSRDWSIKGEYLFVDFGSLSASGLSTGIPPQPFTHTVNLEFNILRFGLNYHF